MKETPNYYTTMISLQVGTMSNSDDECLKDDPELAAMFTDEEEEDEESSNQDSNFNVKRSGIKQNIGKLFNFGNFSRKGSFANRKSIKRSG